MYHCHIHFYLIGHQHNVFEIIKGMPPLEHFTHEFSESSEPEKALAVKADVILANLQDMNVKEALQALTLSKRSDAELILLADKDQIMLLTDDPSDAKSTNASDDIPDLHDSCRMNSHPPDSLLEKIKDIWTMPMSDAEIRFHFLRWQQTCKMSKDFWQTSHYFETTINSIPNLIWYKDKEGIHKKVNDSFCKTVGKTKKQVEGRNHAYIWDVDHDDPACMESELEVMQKKQTCVSEEIIKTGDGTRLLTTYKSPLYNLDGSVMGTVGVAIDITQERAYEEEIIRKNHTLETIFTTMDCGVMCHTVDGSRILSVNRAALGILGYESQEELMAEGFNMVAASVVDEDKEKIQESIKHLKKEGDSVSLEYRIQHKNGDILHVMGNVKLLKENGELFYQRFLLDCTAQKLQEKKNERYQMELIQALSIDYNLVCSFDLDTGIGMPLQIDDNDTLNSIFTGQISLNESMELYIQKCVHEDDREILRQAFSLDRLKKELSEKNLYYVNYRVFRDNKIKYFQIKVVRAGSWSESHGIVLGFRSVDEEIRNEIEKKNMLEDALLQANNANRAKSVFLSNMSHDIRTPMNAIVGFTSLAITHIDHKEQVKEYLEKIMTSGNHLLSLINDILDMSHIESGKMHLEEKPCSLPDILHGLRNIVQADIQAKRLELHIDTVDVLNEDIYCDKLRLNQVLLNLLSNSIKYTEAGGTVDMKVIEKTGAPAGYANYEFYIRDTGIGMSKEFISHIFEPFERERTSTINKIQGTGLGMSITKNIVDMMHGTIKVESEQGTGSVFTVSFTFRLDSDTTEPQDIPEFKNCKALIVNDNRNTCENVSNMLKQIGMHADWTSSGTDAVLRTHQAITSKNDYSLYIIDWELPDMSGIEAIRQIKKEAGADVPIIALTACDWADIEDEAREAGITAFCSKPLFLSELRSCLYSIVHTADENKKSTNSESAKLRSGRILLAEDIEMNQEIAVAILDGAGFSTEVAENGQIAVNMLKKSEPGYYQLVLMDVHMPVMNGYEATKKIRSLENTELASIPILAMTANAFEEDKQEALKCGMNGHIAKPIDVKKLFDTLDKILY